MAAEKWSEFTEATAPEPDQRVPWLQDQGSGLDNVVGTWSQVLTLVTQQEERYLTAYHAALAAGDADIVVAGDSMTVSWEALGGFRGWLYVMQRRFKQVYGTADVTTAPADTPAAIANIRVHNMSVAGYTIEDHLEDGDFIDRCTSVQPALAVICCGLASFTSEAYLPELTAGIEAVQAVCDADVLVIHEYAPNLPQWEGWILGAPAARDEAHRLGAAFYSLGESLGTGPDLYGPGKIINLFDMTGTDPAVATDNLHTNSIGQQTIGDLLTPLMIPVQAPRADLLPYPQWKSQRAALASSTTETSLLPSTFTCPGYSLDQGHKLELSFYGNHLNLTGSAGITFRWRIKVGGVTILDQTYTQGALSGATIYGYLKLFVLDEGSPSVIFASANLEAADSNGLLTGEGGSVPPNDPLTVSTLADIEIDITGQMSASNAAHQMIVTASHLDRSGLPA